MYAYKEEPEVDFWNEYRKPEFIENKIKTICADIAKRGALTNFDKFFDMVYEFIDENIEEFEGEDYA